MFSLNYLDKNIPNYTLEPFIPPPNVAGSIVQNDMHGFKDRDSFFAVVVLRFFSCRLSENVYLSGLDHLPTKGHLVWVQRHFACFNFC